jgi:hypothetical protein
MTKAEEILRAWFTSINPTDEQYQKAINRLSKCTECEHRNQTIIDYFDYCDLCGCPLRKKIFTPKEEGCPLKKW